MEMLETAFAILQQRMISFPKTGKKAGITETGGHGVAVTMSTRQRIIRTMNLCIGVYHAYERRFRGGDMRRSMPPFRSSFATGCSQMPRPRSEVAVMTIARASRLHCT
jgi:hypothetical protein